ncbi:PREDICTED: protein LNK1-like isoform X1 [Camelina sativa]|uniref:Protein LNK1-like isoform X1 n=2 Tax=Camelina sativa TaxID=90675 RepID=A0ABM1R4Z8_CAMSA|nr:PREDICTED: protein LNK1-like isoform X1 [Camelina sativa]XP_019094086.1 PREDICTED: protein LNK1-like isoform X1 [Camelina sativa]
MSGFYVDELDDDGYSPNELHGNDDGIVPDSVYGDGGQFSVLVSSRKKRRNEDMGSGTNRLKSNTFIKREDDMLGRNSWANKNSGASTVSGKDVQDMTLENANISDHGFTGGSADVVENFSTADPMLCDNSATTHDVAYNYSLNNIPNAENNLNFFDNGDKESNDLFYGWDDIGNFEDVDNMLRSCDSTFGLNSLNNEDDLGWFSSAQPNEETEGAMTDDLKPDKMLESQRTSMLQVEDFLNNSESNHTLEDEYVYTVAGNSAQGKSSENLSDTSSQKMDISMLDVEANFEKKQIDHLNHLHGFSENSSTLQNSGISREIMDTNQYYPPSEFQQRGVPFSHVNCEQPSDQVSACESKSGIKSEKNANTSSASNESYTSNQAQSGESLQGQTVDDRCRRGFETRVNLQPGQDMPPSFAASTRKSSKKNPMVFPDAAPIQKIGLKNDHKKTAAESETSNMQGSSCVSSVVDDISLEAISFRQLQRVIEQLDVRTKLCIRDSLYRLAKSAEQRHNGGNRQDTGAGSHLVTGETDKYAGFIDIETDTNPIDRSIAHLLFHRPSDSSLSSDNDVLTYKSHPMIPQPNSSPSLRIEKQEETPELRPEAEVVTNDSN